MHTRSSGGSDGGTAPSTGAREAPALHGTVGILGLFPHPQQSWKPVQGTAAPQQVDEQAWLGPSGTSCSERTNLACKPWWAGPAQGFCSLPATYLPRNLVPISHLAAIS